MFIGKNRTFLTFLFISLFQISYTLFTFQQSYSIFGAFWKAIDFFANPLLTPHYNIAKVQEDEKFDFIVVGAGSSGCVLANRLSEISSWNILLIEAGDAPNYIGDVPAAAGLLHFSKYNWGYKMEKQKDFGLGLDHNQMQWPRGKGLGGSSLINYMIYIRGNKLDYDKWGEKNAGWTYKDMFPYFIKMENSHLSDGDPGYHASGGNLELVHPPYVTKIAKVYGTASEQTGFNFTDYNGANQLGAAFIQGNLINGLRDSAEKAYLRPVKDRSNLKILTNARAAKVLIDPKSKKAIGVQYFHKNSMKYVYASKEIILSAGAFHSPQLLMLSGIGPEKELKKFNIPLIQNLPVGQKLYDHLPFFGVVYSVDKPITNSLSLLLNPLSIFKFLIQRNGPLTMLGGAVEFITYIKTNVTNSEATYPDMELLFINLGLNTDYGLALRTSFGISDDTYDKFFKPLYGKHIFQVLPTLIHPKSHGTVKLQSDNPLDAPKLFGNFCSDPENIDIKNFIAAIRQIQNILKAPIFKQYNIKQYRKPIPGCENYKFDSDHYWECGIRHITATFHHQVASCKMGPDDDAESVVDNKMHVKGIKQLRVVDLSIVPLPLTAHTNVPAMVIAERASDIIKKDYLTTKKE